AIAGAATYAYFLRPIGAAGQPDFVVNNRESFVRLGWYVSPLGLASSVAGVGRALIGAGLANVPLLLVSLGETLLHLVDARVTPIHFWAFRRFHPVALPTIAVFAGVLIVYLANERRSLRALAYTLGGGLMAWSAVVSAPILSHREYAGAPAALSAFRAELDANAVALYEWRGESFRLALPLQHLLGLTGYLVPPKGTDDPRLVDLVRSQVERGRTVYWVSVGGERDGLRRRFEVEPVTTHAWQWPEWEGRTDRRPERLSALSIVFDVLRLQPIERERADRRMLEFLDVGERDESRLGEGFGPSTSLAGCASCRRLTGRAEIRLAEPSQVDLELSLGLAGGRQPNAPLARVAIGVNGRRLGSRTLSNDFRTYYFDLRGVQPGAPVVVSIETEPDGWSGPGIGVDWARLTAPG
ncbi:MAG: hypothetical protein HY329_20080, partial [Chloroflexi bacterium]|nr:hypothetical protein [Chloroflexota bacterium]